MRRSPIPAEKRCAGRCLPAGAPARSSTGPTATRTADAAPQARPIPSRRSPDRPGTRGRDGLVLVVVHADDLVEAGEVEDLPVVVGQPVGGQLLVRPLG